MPIPLSHVPLQHSAILPKSAAPGKSVDQLGHINVVPPSPSPSPDVVPMAANHSGQFPFPQQDHPLSANRPMPPPLPGIRYFPPVFPVRQSLLPVPVPCFPAHFCPPCPKCRLNHLPIGPDFIPARQSGQTDSRNRPCRFLAGTVLSRQLIQIIPGFSMRLSSSFSGSCFHSIRLFPAVLRYRFFHSPPLLKSEARI